MGEGASVPGCLRVTLGEVDGELVADRCWLLGATAIGEPAGAGVLEVGFESAEAAGAAATALGEWWPGIEVLVVDAGPALDAALAAWKPHARPLRVGGLHLRPRWLDPDDDPPAAGERVVVVDPTRAFGYDHPSTAGCLEVVARDARPGIAVLDVGCGSGVLAVAAAVLGAAPVVAIDTDPVAVAATRAAAAGNGVSVSASTAAVGELTGTFDLVLANIGVRTITALAPSIAARVAPGGRLVLAGLLVGQATGVVRAYEQEGLAWEATGERGGWARPLLRRKTEEIHHF